MERIVRVGVVLAVLMVFVGGPQAEATIVELPLDAAGEYGLSDTWTTSFDVGVEFTEIVGVYIRWSGEMLGYPTMNSGVIDTQFVGTLYEADPHEYFGRAYVQGGADTYPSPEMFDVETGFTAQDWGELLDGQGSIEIFYSDTTHVLDIGAPSEAVGILNDAALVVEGTIVPEPGTILFFGVGGVLLAARRRRS